MGEALERRVLTGGYPEALHRSSESRHQAWARSYLNAILQRDVREIASVDKLQSLPQLLTALAQVCGQLCNYTQLGARIGLDGKTVTRYITLLEQLFQVRRVPAWSANGLGQVVGVEVKAAASVQAAPCVGLSRLASQAGDRFLGGVILYDGIQTLPMGSVAGRPIWALPLASLWHAPPLP